MCQINPKEPDPVRFDLLRLARRQFPVEARCFECGGKALPARFPRRRSWPGSLLPVWDAARVYHLLTAAH